MVSDKLETLLSPMIAAITAVIFTGSNYLRNQSDIRQYRSKSGKVRNKG